MAKYIIDSETLDGLADAIRSVTGTTRKFTPDEMIEEVKDVLNATTFVLVDKDGNEYPAVYVDSDVMITATPNDIRKGTTAITSEGVITGEKEIPSYYTTEGYWLIPAGSKFAIPFKNDDYNFTKLQAILCPFTNSIENSVSTDKVSIDGKVYSVNSTEVLSVVSVNSEKREIDLGIVNDSTSRYLVRYFTYREVY